jgi:hypothetical protein
MTRNSFDSKGFFHFGDHPPKSRWFSLIRFAESGLKSVMDAWTGCDSVRQLIATSTVFRRSNCSPGKAGWWVQLFTALLFAFYVNYIPIHLAAETHLEEALATVVADHHHHEGHADGDHHDDSDHHIPHQAADHLLTLAASTKALGDSAQLIFFLPAATSFLIGESELRPAMPVYERSRPPGESPPDPQQPRAPPRA